MRWTIHQGGVSVSPADLREMQAGDYILHGKNGKLSRIPVKKTRIPLDPHGHVQTLAFIQCPDGSLYACQATIISKSTDGGMSWDHLTRTEARANGTTKDGTLLRISRAGKDPARDPIKVWASNDDAATWDQFGTVETPHLEQKDITKHEWGFGWYGGFCPTLLKDGTLLFPVQKRDAELTADASTVLSGEMPLYVFRSKDDAQTFHEYSVIDDWCTYETNIMELPSGKLIAVIRYQRPNLITDYADLRVFTGAAAYARVHGISHAGAYKHVFLADSLDGGRTWRNLRQLTTEFGQCFGSGVGLADGSVVVVHDHRYPRNLSSGRALVSRDEGISWEDEVYYLCHGDGAGYSYTVTLDGKEMLTFIGSVYGDIELHSACTGKSHFDIIRWKLVD